MKKKYSRLTAKQAEAAFDSAPSIPISEDSIEKMVAMATTPKSEYEPRFWERMLQAMGMSFHKYGPVKKGFPHKVNAVGSLKDRIKKYEETGNKDYLVDAANFAMIEFMLPAHVAAHDNPTDGGEGRKWHAGGPLNERKNTV